MSISNPVVASWDGPNRRIYLASGIETFHWIEDIYREYRNWRRTQESSRKWLPFMRASGNDYKGGGKYTPRYVTLLDGVRVIPYDENILIEVKGEAITDNADIDPDPFDTSTRTQPLKLYITPPSSELVRAEAEIAAVKRMEYAERVVVDVLSSYSGTDYPIGTAAYPVNNITDAMYIANSRGFSSLYIIGNITLTTGDVISNMLIVGQDQILTTIVILDGANVINTKFQTCSITGTLDGGNTITACRIVGDLHYVNGFIWQCLISPGTIFLEGNADALFMDCWSGSTSSETPPTIDMGGSGQSLGVRGYNGALEIINKDGLDYISIDLNSGSIILQDSVTNGTIVLRGVGMLEDSSSGNTIVISDGLMSKQTISSAVAQEIGSEIQYASFGGGVTIDIINGVSGTLYPIGTIISPVNNLFDAQLIADNNGFGTLYIKGDLTLHDGDDISYYTIRGEDRDSTNLILENGCITTAANLYDLLITGHCGGRMNIHNCHLSDIIGFCASGGDSNIVNTHLMGTIQLRSFADRSFNFINCIGAIGLDVPTIDVNNCSASIHFSDFAGYAIFKNMTVPTQHCALDIDSGRITLDSSITQGMIAIRGIAKLTNNTIPQNGLFVDTSGLMRPVDTQYNGRVYIDVLGSQGTEYPYGLRSNPVNNIDDAIIIAYKYGANELHIHSDITILSGTNVSTFILASHSTFKYTLTLQDGCITDNTIFRDMKITGSCGGWATYENVLLKNINNLWGNVENAILDGTIVMHSGESTHVHMKDVRSHTQEPVVLSIDGAECNAINVFGMFNIHNKIAGGEFNMHLGYGRVLIDSSCVGGNIYIAGYGEVIDNSNGSFVTNETFTDLSIAKNVWDNSTINTMSGTFGEIINNLYEDIGLIGNKINTIYNKLPIGSIASVGEYSDDILDIKNKVERSLGLVQENYCIDQTNYIEYNGSKLMSSGRMRIYRDAASVGTDNNVIATYSIDTSWSNEEMSSYKVTRV